MSENINTAKWQWEHGLLTVEEYLDRAWLPYHGVMSNRDIAAELNILNEEWIQQWRVLHGV